MCLAARSVVRAAALQRGPVQVRIDRVKLALVEILDIRNIVAISVYPSLSRRVGEQKLNEIISLFFSLISLSPVSEVSRITRITDAAVILSISEFFENLVFPTECRSELLVTTTFVS